jgi:hypothetical protein
LRLKHLEFGHAQEEVQGSIFGLRSGYGGAFVEGLENQAQFF